MYFKNKNIDKLNIFENYDKRDNFFLATGYFLDTQPRLKLPLPNKNKIDEYNSLSIIDKKELFFKFWTDKIENNFVNDKNLVLLSGGIDSRAILFGLLKNTEAKNINTLTFGKPGSLDYEIGNNIAKKIGTRHSTVEIDKNILDYDNLIDFGENTDYSTNLFLSMPTSVYEKYSDYNIWSGTVIDVYYGRHNHIKPNCNYKDMVSQFIDENIICNNARSMVDEVYVSNNLTLCSNSIASPHILDLYNRQTKFVANHLLLKKYKFSNMLSQDLIDLSFSIPNDFLENQRFYIDCFSESYQNFNDFGCKTTFGAKLDSSVVTKYYYRLKNKIIKNSYVNYTNWSELILSKEFKNFLQQFCTSQQYNDVIKMINQSYDPLIILNFVSLLLIKKMN